CSFSCSLGVFGAETNETQSAMEGDSVTLNTDVTEIREIEDIFWHYRDQKSFIAKINRENKISSIFDDVPDGRFRDRLKLDNQTGSLTITNIRTEHAGVYKLQISGVKVTLKTFSVSVYGDCVTLSWYKGNSLLSSISVSVKYSIL
uniref:Immunoglobulin domain-containing protein n=1 Tax=Sinocyclocheilus grahami TaxID=75366 RepID=A0A672N6S0_SINGR